MVIFMNYLIHVFLEKSHFGFNQNYLTPFMSISLSILPESTRKAEVLRCFQEIKERPVTWNGLNALKA